MARIIGNNGNNSLFGGAEDDLLLGNGGNDQIVGAKGNDTMIGGLGNDILVWNNGDGSDRMSGGRGNDIIAVNGTLDKGDAFTLAQNGNLAIFNRVNLKGFTLTVDTSEQFNVRGLGGNDRLSVSDLSNTSVRLVNFSGGAGNDFLNGRNTSTRIVARGGPGNDTLIGSSGNDTLFGNTRNDLIIGAKGNDTMIGGLNNDTLVWNNGDGSDRMGGGQGNDIIAVNGTLDKGDAFTLAQNGNLAIFNRVNLKGFTLTVDTSEQFSVKGLGGNDRLSVSDLSNTDVNLVNFSGGAGNDVLNGRNTSTRIIARGGPGNDTLIGSQGNDTLLGNTRNDLIIGAKGNDTMIGGLNNDILVWNNGDGSDRMGGGQGNDIIAVNGTLDKGDAFTLAQNGNLAIFNRVNLKGFTLTVDTSEQFNVRGLGGNDRLSVSDLSNTSVRLVNFSGGAGNDFLNGRNTNTRIVARGGAGNDRLIGGRGRDTLIGGAGRDTLIGGANDVLIGDANDVLIGGIRPNTLSLNLNATGNEVNHLQNSASLSHDDFAVVANDAQAAFSDALIPYSASTGTIYHNQNSSDTGYGDDLLTVPQGNNTLTNIDPMTT